MPEDSIDETEKYLKDAERNIEASFGFIFRMVYKLVYSISGVFVKLYFTIMPDNKGEKDESDIF